jgi:hypothetical protein
VDKIRCLGFCVSVDHARYMERVFKDHGVNAKAVWAKTDDDERKQSLEDLQAGRINVLFSVDLFNEGVDVPSVDALLMLRPTESPLLFLQQLGRGLRKCAGKTLCTVLDFVGQHRKEFRYDRRFRALLGGSRLAAIRQIEDGFPFLPAGCHMELDRIASERVLANIKQSVPDTWPARAAELDSINREHPGILLGTFLEISGLELDDVYSNSRSWSDLKDKARIQTLATGPHERILRRACSRLLHVDDEERIRFWSHLLRTDTPPHVEGLPEREVRLVKMLLAQILDQVATNKWTLRDGVEVLWQHQQIRSELVELLSVLLGRITHVSTVFNGIPNIPLRIHAQYTRDEILSALQTREGFKAPPWQAGVFPMKDPFVDLLAFTLDKTSKAFSPTTRYRDYAISRELIHWESQSVTRANSDTGRRYQNHQRLGSYILLFARHSNEDRAFYFLGPASYVRHEGELPMAITWKLHRPLPGDLFASFAAAVA